MKKLFCLVLCLCLMTVGCGPKAPDGTPAGTEPNDTPAQTAPQPSEASGARIRILDTDPDRESVWLALAEEYGRLTGVEVILMTSEAAPLSLEEDWTPTIFTVSSQAQGNDLEPYCLNLSGQPVCNQLLSGNFSLRYGDKILGISAKTEFFGLVYSTSLLARAGYTRADIQSIADLAAIVGDISENRKALGFAAFACPDLSNTDAQSFAALFGSVPADLRDFWDLYIQNAACSQAEIAARATSGGLEELLEGEAVFYLAGANDYEKFRAMQDHELGMIPIFFESANQQSQGLCAVDTDYWCVHANAAEADQQAALAFLNWLVVPRQDGTVPVDAFCQMAPYRQATFADGPLETAARAELLSGKQAVICDRFAGSVEELSQALATYAADPSDANWAAVEQIRKG